MNKFDREFNDMFNRNQRLVRRGFTLASILSLFSFLFSIALIAAAVYVAVHFISKFW